MKVSELKRILKSLGKGKAAKIIVHEKIGVSIRIIDYWLTGHTKIKPINAYALRTLVPGKAKPHAHISSK